jgi:hypothetical protein
VQRIFWPIVVGASVLEAAAAASFAVAVFSAPTPRRVFEYEPSQAEVFGRVTSLDWSTDSGFLIGAIVCFAVGSVLYVVAPRSR